MNITGLFSYGILLRYSTVSYMHNFSPAAHRQFLPHTSAKDPGQSYGSCSGVFHDSVTISHRRV